MLLFSFCCRGLLTVFVSFVEYQGNLHYMHLVTEMAKNLCLAMSIEEITDVVAAMEVVKNAKRTECKYFLLSLF